MREKGSHTAGTQSSEEEVDQPAPGVSESQWSTPFKMELQGHLQDIFGHSRHNFVVGVGGAEISKLELTTDIKTSYHSEDELFLWWHK